jgi:hypothetical protein
VGSTTVNLTALALNPADGQMYCSIGNDSSFSRQICTIDLSTAAVTVKPTVNPWVIPDMHFAPNGTLYGIRKLGDALALVSINTTNGAATQIGSGITLNSGGNAFAISPAGVAYWLTSDGKLRTIDLSTGVASAGSSVLAQRHLVRNRRWRRMLLTRPAGHHQYRYRRDHGCRNRGQLRRRSVVQRRRQPSRRRGRGSADLPVGDRTDRYGIAGARGTAAATPDTLMAG